MKREFKYDTKETYSQKDVDALLEQHSKFVTGGFKGFVSPDDYKKVQDQLTGLQQEKQTSLLKSRIEKYTDKVDVAFKLLSIEETDDEAGIDKKIKDLVAEYDFLQKQGEQPPELLQGNGSQPPAPIKEAVDMSQ